MEPKTCQKGPKLGFEYWPTSKTLHCVRTACMAFPKHFGPLKGVGWGGLGPHQPLPWGHRSWWMVRPYPQLKGPLNLWIVWCGYRAKQSRVGVEDGRGGGGTQVKERFTHARPGMHMQQCSAFLTAMPSSALIQAHCALIGLVLAATTSGFNTTYMGGGGIGPQKMPRVAWRANTPPLVLRVYRSHPNASLPPGRAAGHAGLCRGHHVEPLCAPHPRPHPTTAPRRLRAPPSGWGLRSCSTSAPSLPLPRAPPPPPPHGAMFAWHATFLLTIPTSAQIYPIMEKPPK